MLDPKKIQEEYYSKTAKKYDHSHLEANNNKEHEIALAFLSAMIEFYKIESILDVGAGTGRTISYIQENHPNVHVVGYEPVKELREIGYNKGISKSILKDGVGESMNENDNSFDLVCEFAVLHHVKYPNKVVEEMSRIAKKGIFISDSNNFGQGSRKARLFKQLLNFLNLWRVYDFIRTSGKMYQISEGDGLFYSYSVFNNLPLIKKKFKKIHFFNTKDGSYNLYKTASHLVMFAIEKRD